ncbi:major outer membrane protein [Arcobacter sp.]|uniref:major outer membrane protein n=1 Tax=Arcobacter sp. TaxID=1872629 RepID=UPI003D0F93A2
MKKFVKLSLVAAVAVAGLTTANAKPLEEAIKGVDVSGTVAYQYNDRSNDDQTDGNNYTKHLYKAAITLKANATDDITVVTKTIIGGGNTLAKDPNSNSVAATTSSNDMAAISAGGSDAQASFGLSQANFVYTGIANTTFIAGKQAVPSPFAVQADATGDEDTGNGLTAVVNAGPVTIAGTYLQNTNFTSATGANLDVSGQALYGLGVMGNVGPVSLDGWYLRLDEKNDNTDDGAKAYTLGVSGKVNVVSFYARYSALNSDINGIDTGKLFKLGAKAKIGIVGFGVDYGMTNDVNGTATGVNITGDSDADVGFQGWGVDLANRDDAQMYKLNVNVDVTSNINLSVNYNDLSVDSAANSDENEWVFQATHKVAKNFSYYVRLGQVDKDSLTDKGSRGRLNIVYSF